MNKLSRFGVIIFISATFGCITLTYSQSKKASGVKRKSVRRVVVVNQNEQRIWIEKQLLKGEYEHDGSGELLYIGTIESVPALLAVVSHYKVGPNGSMICTRAHALAALHKITGQNLGSSFDAWADWWEINKVELLKKKK